jgi:hypothetical protein
MFWWLWSTKKKVTVLLGLLLLPVLAFTAFSRFSGESPEPSEVPVDVATSATVSEATGNVDTTDPASNGATGEAPTGEPVEQSVPFLFASDTSRSATTALGEVAWLINDSLTPNVILPGAGKGYSLWALHQNVSSFTELSDRYVTLYDFAGDVSIKKETSSLHRLTFSGSAQGVKFTAEVRLLDVGGGRVSVAGVVTTDGVPGPVTAEPKRPTQQPTETTGQAPAETTNGEPPAETADAP